MKRLSIDHQIKSAHNEYLYQVIRIISIQNKCSQLWTKMDDHISKIHRLYILIGILIYLWSYTCHENQRRSKSSFNFQKKDCFVIMVLLSRMAQLRAYLLMQVKQKSGCVVNSLNYSSTSNILRRFKHSFL